MTKHSLRISFSLIFITLSIILAYHNIFYNSFVWDDEYFVLKDEGVWNLKNIPTFFSQTVHNVYRPIRTITYSIAHNLWGLDIKWYHFTSIFLHTICTSLVFLIALKILTNIKSAFVTACLFGVHPVHTERVTFITASFELISELFFFLSFLYYLLWEEKKNNVRYIISIIAYLIAIFASEMTITLPFIIILYQLFFYNKLKIKSTFPYFICAVFYLIIRFFVIKLFARDTSYIGGGLYPTFLTMCNVFTYYIFLLIYPINLKAIYDFPISYNLTLLEISSITFLIFLIILALILRKKIPLLSFIILWFFISLAPVSNIVPTGTIIAERYLYLASFSICLLVGFLFKKLWNEEIPNILRNNIIQIILILSFTIISITFIIETYYRNMIWYNGITLWSDTVKKSPNSSVAHNNLGNAYKKMGLIYKAIAEHKQAIEINPFFEIAYNNLGSDYLELGKFDEAMEQFQKAIEIYPKFALPYYNIALIYKNKNEYKLAYEYIKKAYELEPKNPNFLILLAVITDNLGKLEEASFWYREYLKSEGESLNKESAKIRLKEIEK